MAKHTKTKNLKVSSASTDAQLGKIMMQANGTSWTTVNNTQSLYCRLASEAYEAGLLKDVTYKTYQSYRTGLTVIHSPLNHHLVSNQSMTTSKLIDFVTTNDSRDPISVVNRSSMQLAQRRTQLEMVALYLKHRYHVDMHVYMLTLTIENCDKGQLYHTVRGKTGLIALASKLTKALLRGTQRNNGLRLVGEDGSPVNFYGSLNAFEMTLQKEVLKHLESKGLYHPHIHMLMMVDKPLNVEVSKGLLFKRWKQLTQGRGWSYEAFNLKHSYSRSSLEPNESSLVASAVEASKYVLKPDAIGRLDDAYDADSDFALEVFAEIHQAQKGLKSNNVSGVVWQAVHYYNLFKPLMNAMGLRLSNDLPDVMTQLSDLSYNRKSKRYYTRHNRPLTDGEVLYFNKSLIKHLAVSSDFTNFDSTALTKLHADLKSMVDAGNYDASYADNLKQLELEMNRNGGALADWLDVMASVKLPSNKSDVLGLIQASIDAQQSTLDDLMLTPMPDAVQVYQFKGKIADLTRLMTVIQNHLYDGKPVHLTAMMPELNDWVDKVYKGYGAIDPFSATSLMAQNANSIPQQLACRRRAEIILAHSQKAIYKTGIRTRFLKPDDYRYLSTLISCEGFLNKPKMADLKADADKLLPFTRFVSNLAKNAKFARLTMKQMQVVYQMALDCIKSLVSSAVTLEDIEHVKPAKLALNLNLGGGLMGIGGYLCGNL